MVNSPLRAYGSCEGGHSGLYSPPVLLRRAITAADPTRYPRVLLEAEGARGEHDDANVARGVASPVDNHLDPVWIIDQLGFGLKFDWPKAILTRLNALAAAGNTCPLWLVPRAAIALQPPQRVHGLIPLVGALESQSQDMRLLAGRPAFDPEHE
jgi:hypothetical protein